MMQSSTRAVLVAAALFVAAGAAFGQCPDSIIKMTPQELAVPLAPVRVVHGTTEQRHSPGVIAALHLLRSPRTMATAVVLQEVLGPPKCRRR